MDTRFPGGAAATVAEFRRRFDEYLSATTKRKDTTKVPDRAGMIGVHDIEVDGRQAPDRAATVRERMPAT